MQGQLLAGRYRLAEPLGKGGMGRVWRAHDEVLHRAVAIKELTAALYVSESDQAVLLARTRAEARAAARINHSAVVTVHDVLDHDNRPWIVMELVEGHSLADAVKEQGRIEPTEAARVGLWVLRALRAAHTAGVLHRDVKPGNVLLGRDGRVLLTDFGIAQIEGDTTITRTGEVVGSVDYLAPERIRGQDPGPSSDLWALGATLYTAVEGRSPFRRTTPLTTMQAVVDEEPAEPRYAGPLGPVIAALLHKDPAVRPGMVEAEQLLAEAAEGRRPSGAQAYVATRPAGLPGTAAQHSGTRHVGSDHVGSRYTGPHHAGPHHAGPHHAGPHHAGSGQEMEAPSGGRSSAAATPARGTPYRPTPYAAAIGSTGSTGPVGPSGPTALGPVPAGATAPPPTGRRRLRTLALVVALAAIIGGGTSVVMQKWHEGLRTSGVSASPSPSPTPANEPSETPDGTVPAGWESVEDPLGFGLAVPKGWQRSVFGDQGDLRQIDYSPDGGKHLLRIAVDSAPDFNDPYEHQVDLDGQLARRLMEYERVSLQRRLYRDRQGSRLEYGWTAQAKDTDSPGPYRALDQMYITRNGVEYAIYMASPAEDWATTQQQFEIVLQSWREIP
ncbi:serine/threonine-protein kinase [Streptomyces sp. ALI-76-A]|uniref:serine/threonine-protein kinase n=1 Tax=Streptomyces sp. ALI-76-A TaxID=3025736 RepID=UPI00256F4382|nr:serine/threonine-protein kinase [Streptomyces sp. ALI-76-A]MDL5203314.1 protein kinase [Streptomyces sp. ALI-76-A]